MQVQSLGQEDPLEEGMATHSSILAWRISWTEESGRLQYIRSQRVRHDWSDLAWHMTWDTKNFTCFPKRVLIHICFSHSLGINFLIIFYYKFMIIQPNHWSQSMNQYSYNFISGHFYVQTNNQEVQCLKFCLLTGFPFTVVLQRYLRKEL